MPAAKNLRLFEMVSHLAIQEPSRVWWLVCNKCQTLLHSRWTIPISGDLGEHLMKHEACPNCGGTSPDLRTARPCDLEAVGIYQRVMDYNEA